MGLDMYLTKRHYVQQWQHIPPEQQFQVTVSRGGQPYSTIKPERVSYVIEQVAYWRKANAVHRWFVENIQNGTDDCREYPVGADELSKLLTAVNTALSVRNPGKVLPTESGFFFGSTEYDKYYKDDLRETKRQIEALLAEEGADGCEYAYRSSW